MASAVLIASGTSAVNTAQTVTVVACPTRGLIVVFFFCSAGSCTFALTDDATGLSWDSSGAQGSGIHIFGTGPNSPVNPIKMESAAVSGSLNVSSVNAICTSRRFHVDLGPAGVGNTSTVQIFGTDLPGGEA